MDGIDYMSVNGLVAATCWLLVAIATGIAVFSDRVHDSVLERLGLSCLSISAVGTGYRCLVWGWETPGGMALALSAAIYSSVIIFKHWRHCRTRHRGVA